MRANKVWAFAAVLTLTISVVCGAIVWAQAPPRAGGQHLFGLRALMVLRHAGRQLNLTAEQRQQIRSIVESRKDDIKAVLDRSVAARKALRRAVVGDNHDEIAAAVNEVSAAELKAADLRADIRAKVFSEVLQPDQRAKADQLLSQADQRADQRRHRIDRFLDKF